VIGSSHRSLPAQHITNTQDKYPFLRRDSNPQSQQSNCRTPAPETAPPRGSTVKSLNSYFQDVKFYTASSHVPQAEKQRLTRWHTISTSWMQQKDNSETIILHIKVFNKTQNSIKKVHSKRYKLATVRDYETPCSLVRGYQRHEGIC
jgi:hypothetical protein